MKLLLIILALVGIYTIVWYPFEEPPRLIVDPLLVDPLCYVLNDDEPIMEFASDHEKKTFTITLHRDNCPYEFIIEDYK